MQFVQNNLLLIAVAVLSGGMLLWPFLRRSAGGPWVTPAQATHLVNREDALFLDVRDPGEYGTGHVLGAKNVPLSRLDQGAPAELGKRKEKPLIVYDGAGDRSSKAVAALKKQGFTRVVNLNGGLKAWQQAGLPIEK